MEEHKLVPKEKNEIVFDEKIYGVKVERSRRKRKRKRSFKKAAVFLLIICLVAIAASNYSKISSFVSSLFTSTNPLVQSTGINDNKNDTSDNSNEESENTSSEITNYEFDFIDTSPTEFRIINENYIPASDSHNIPSVNDIYRLYGDNAPVVLIVNYSPKECYSQGEGYSFESVFYSDDNNVVKIGEQLCASLNTLGVNTIHLQIEFDGATLTQYQQNYEKEIERVLESYPSIAFVFDISRSLTINSDMSISREQVELNGVSVPTVKLICGTDNGALTETQEKGIYIAKEFAKHTNKNAPLLISVLEISSLNLNLKFSVPCVRIEIGSYACTYEASSLAVGYVALSLSTFLE